MFARNELPKDDMFKEAPLQCFPRSNHITGCPTLTALKAAHFNADNKNSSFHPIANLTKFHLQTCEEGKLQLFRGVPHNAPSTGFSPANQTDASAISSSSSTLKILPGHIGTLTTGAVQLEGVALGFVVGNSNQRKVPWLSGDCRESGEIDGHAMLTTNHSPVDLT